MEIEQPLEVGKLYRVTDNVDIDNELDYGRHILVTYCERCSSEQHWWRILLGEPPPRHADLDGTVFGYSVSYLYGEREFNLFFNDGQDTKMRDLFEEKKEE